MRYPIITGLSKQALSGSCVKRSRSGNIRKAPVQQNNQLRIIGGRWRGRKLHFCEVEGLRPTGDRIRESLFNWLSPSIYGANCLDLFAGSGALGFEALSRGAARVSFVDSSATVTAELAKQLALLDCNDASISQTDGVDWLVRGESVGFDIVFLDPPFMSGLLPDCLSALEHRPDILNPGALIYFETERSKPLAPLPANWQLYRHKETGQVQYGLIVTGEQP